jgi:HSP20 family protein
MAEHVARVPVTTGKTKAAESSAGPFERLRSEIDHAFDDFTRGYWHLPFTAGRVFDVAPYWRGDFALAATPAVDIAEQDDAYVVTAELPGIDAKNVEVRFADNTLTMRGEKTEETEEKKKDYYLSERRYGSFYRSFRVPEGVEADKIEATVKNGVLTVRLPKSAEAKKKTKTIQVKSAA